MKFKALFEHTMVMGGNPVEVKNIVDVITSTKEKAIEKVAQIIKEDYNDDVLGGQIPNSVELYCIAEIIQIDVDAIHDAIHDDDNEFRRAEERLERAELKRLREKYPD